MKTREEVLAQLDVSRETAGRLDRFATLLRKWNPAINLISRKGLEALWNRHIADSIQVFQVAPEGAHWVDLGSGGGFPGLIAAILAIEDAPETRFTLIESDQRKAAFLSSAIREVGASCAVVSERIEAVEPQAADILSARALTDLDGLLGFAAIHLARGGVALFPKGEAWKKEVEAAHKSWHFRFDPITSITEPRAVILKVKEVTRV